MNKKIFYIVSFACTLSLVGATSVFAQSENGSKQTGEQHRSAVANVVQELIKIGDRDIIIGEEVKTVAQEEKGQSEIIKEKMDNVENRSGFKTFFIGSDYKNLGELRSELVTSQNHLDRLNKALERATSETIETDLEEQIAELETIKTKAESFVKENESKFSLFGWVVRLFNK
jgi:hypothetical protein